MRLPSRQISFLILIAHLLTGCKPTVENGIIDNGLYEVKYDSFSSKSYEDFKLEVKGFSYKKYLQSGQQETGILETVDKDAFIMKGDSSKDRQIVLDSLTDFQKTLQKTFDSWGPLCIVVKKESSDTIQFVTRHTGEPHFILNKGILIKR